MYTCTYIINVITRRWVTDIVRPMHNGIDTHDAPISLFFTSYYVVTVCTFSKVSLYWLYIVNVLTIYTKCKCKYTDIIEFLAGNSDAQRCRCW
jgi:hypothetical protein